MRAKLEDRYATYVKASEKAALLVALQEAEEWLYSDEGSDAQKSAYVARLDALRALGDPVAFRCRETEERARAVAQLRETLNDYATKASSTDERFAHIDDKDKQSVLEKCATVHKWLDDLVARQAERPRDEDPVLKTVDVAKKRDEVIYFATPILTKPKPKPPVVPTPSGGTPKETGTPRTDTPDPGKAGKQGEREMDVD
jgi:heat shock protein 4